ncbi:MAG: hypothetical protein AB1797_07210 [bacterium]
MADGGFKIFRPQSEIRNHNILADNVNMAANSITCSGQGKAANDRAGIGQGPN